MTIGQLKIIFEDLKSISHDGTYVKVYHFKKYFQQRQVRIFNIYKILLEYLYRLSIMHEETYIIRLQKNDSKV